MLNALFIVICAVTGDARGSQIRVHHAAGASPCWSSPEPLSGSTPQDWTGLHPASPSQESPREIGIRARGPNQHGRLGIADPPAIKVDAPWILLSNRLSGWIESLREIDLME